MFIREKRKKNKGNPKVYLYHQLVESVRTAEGPRQNLLLDLKELSVPKDNWPLLARCIEARVRGMPTLLSEEPEIKRHADRYAEELLRKYEHESREAPVKRYESIDIESMKKYHVRSIGAEHVGLSYVKKLELDGCLRKLGLSERQVEIASLLIIGRLVSPGSERHTYHWGQTSSGLDELMGTDFSHLSLNSLYGVSDELVRHQEEIEEHLRGVERSLFGLDETIILYDLTNTFFEGEMAENPKARFGPSKEKRTDCRLVTLGMVLDGCGFPKRSKVFAGNQSESKTLFEMIESLRELPGGAEQEKPTVVLDAGIGTEENLAAMRGRYHYICVSRKRLNPPAGDSLITIKEGTRTRVEAELVKENGEVYLYCRSEGRRAKERGIQRRLEQRFEAELTVIRDAIHKKGGTKRYQKVVERIGRARERYKQIAHYYDIEVDEENGIATRVSWAYNKNASDQRFSGSYYLRTDREDLTEEEIWRIYTMLLEVEDAFRTMKSELALRPNYHHKEPRSDGHIFITLLAYHVVHSIRTHLKEHGIRDSWTTLRNRLRTHERVTSGMNTEDGRRLYIRQCSEPEFYHKMIYEALGLEGTPCGRKVFTI
jgi:transposase